MKKFVVRVTYREKFHLVRGLATKILEFKEASQVFKELDENQRIRHAAVMNRPIEMHYPAASLIDDLKKLLEYVDDIDSDKSLDDLLLAANLYWKIAETIYSEVNREKQEQPMKNGHFKNSARIHGPRVTRPTVWKGTAA